MENKEIILEHLKIAEDIITNTKPDSINAFVGYSGECKYSIVRGYDSIEINIYVRNRYLPIYTKRIACIDRSFAVLHNTAKEYNKFCITYETRLATWRHTMGMKNLKVLHKHQGT